MNKCATRHFQHGFSLVQVSMILMVAGLIMVSMLPGGETTSDVAKNNVTMERMRAIEQATQSFMAKNFRRPCPADGEIAIGAAGYGVEMLSADECTGGAIFEGNGFDVVAGTVPTRTLGLSDDFALDGYGRRMMYFLDERAARVATNSTTLVRTCQDLQNTQTAGAIQIANDFSSVTLQDNTMWALVSYGRDGHGAFPPGGSSTPTASRIDMGATDDDTIYNALFTGDGAEVGAYGTQIGSTGSYYGERLVKKEPTDDFDDIIWYNESTKSTCCIGKECKNAFRLFGDDTTITAQKKAVTTDAGDFNGDGIDDLVVSYAKSNIVYVVYGRKTGWPLPLDEDSEFLLETYATNPTGFTVTTTAASTIGNLGRTSAVGDLNNDGYDDLVLGGGTALVVVFGDDDKSSFTVTGDTASDSTDGVAYTTLDTTKTYSTTPSEIAIGDINGDGYKDIIACVSTAGCVNNTTATGAVVFGRAGKAWGTFDLTTVSDPNGFKLTTDSDNAFAKSFNTMASGDINNDGYDDIFVSSGTKRTAFIMFGNTGTATRALDTEIVDTGNDYAIKFESDDLAWWNDDSNFSIAGLFNSIFGIPDAQAGLGGMGGAISYSEFGRAAAVADMNNDGYDDVIISHLENVYIYFGRDFTGEGGDTINVDTAVGGGQAATIDTESGSLDFEVSAISAADMNGDGLKDLILSDDTTNGNEGRTYIVMQPTGGFSGTLVLEDMIDDTPDQIARIDGSVTTGRAFDGTPLDLDGDGKTDLAIAEASWKDGSAAIKGAAFLLWGRDNVTWGTEDLADIP